MQRSVDSPHYHVWTDALHGRHLARNATNEWDRGTYVRWTIVSSWTALEMASEQALDVTGLGHRFFDRVNEALANRSLPPLNTGQGIWQRVKSLHMRRVDYVHKNVDQRLLFASLEEAEEAIGVVREAVKDLHVKLGSPPPQWIDDDENPSLPGTTFATGTVIRAGANPDDPDAVRIAFDFRGEERTSEILPPGSDPIPAMEELLQRVQVPIRSVRAYRGTNLIEEFRVRMRGS